jgi:hypothetical protein
MWHSTLQPWLKQGSPTLHRSGRQAFGRRLSFEPRVLLLEDRTLPSTLTVLNNADSGDGSLRAAIAAAQSGDQVVFDPGLHGQTITLTCGELAITKDLDIEGPGADQLAVSGNHQSRIFDISGGVTVTIAGLTITDGLAVGGPGSGGGIENVGSTLTVANVILANNEALGSSGNGNGRAGAIDNNIDATLTVTHCQFVNNLATGINQATAGAIFTGNNNGSGVGSRATVIDSSFIGNQTIGGDGAIGNNFSRAGAIYNNLGPLTVEHCMFIGNQAIGGSNSTGGNMTGQAAAGAIQNSDQGILFLTGSVFIDNQALGGSHNTSSGGNGNIGTASGGALLNVGVATITDSLFEDNEARGGSENSGDGSSFQFVGTAAGGGIFTSAANNSGTPVSLTLQHVMICNNRAVGGDGNTAATFMGTSQGGGLATNDYNFTLPPGGSTTTVSDSTITDNQAAGGRGAVGNDGADAVGGGLSNRFGATLNVSGSTIIENQSIGGAGGVGANGGNAQGGGLFNDRPSTAPTNLGAPTALTIATTTVTDNSAEGGTAGAGGASAGEGAGGGIASADILTVLGSTLAHNRALGGAGEAGANGGEGLGGGVHVADGIASVLDTAIDYNQAVGGDADAGGTGGNGFGGGIHVVAGTVIVSTSEVTYNDALGGHGSVDGLGIGGGVYNLGTFLFDATTIIAHNHASDSNDDCFGC